MEISKKGKIVSIIVVLFIVLAGISLRLIPHAPNFTPIAAIALFSGVYFSKRIALILPIGAMAISDIFIGFYEPKLMIAVYASFLLFTIIGFWLKKHKSWYLIGGSAILSAVLFFLITNFAVFAFSPWYAKTFSGLIQCYVLALPFFKNTLLGNLFYTGVFFGAYELSRVWIKSKFGVKSKTLASAKI